MENVIQMTSLANDLMLACLSTLWFEAGVHACTLCTCIHVYTYSLTFPLWRDNTYYGVPIWECLISMRSEIIAYFISTVTVIYMLVLDFQRKYMYIHHDVGECYSEASLWPLPHSLQSGSWTDRGDHVWRDCRAMDWI